MAISKGKGRPHSGYYVDGVRVPSVTTVLGRLKECGGLIHWAWKLGTEGQDYREVRDSAASVGTFSHRMIEAEIHGRDPLGLDVPEEFVSRCKRALEAFRRWAESSKLEIVSTERSLVSPTYMYGGTLDGATVRVNGVRAILDFKVSKRVYEEYIAQIAAYRQLVEETDLVEVEEGHLLRLGKDHGTFTHHYFPRSVLDIGWNTFKHGIEVYNGFKIMKDIL